MKKIPTSADILQRAVWKLIVFITLGFEIVIIGASGHQLYERVVINSQRIARKLVKTEIDSEFDWQHWRMNSNLDTENVYFLEVDNLRHAKPPGPLRPKMAFATFYGTACTSRPRFLSVSSG